LPRRGPEIRGSGIEGEFNRQASSAFDGEKYIGV
jgi:hypothetical protein